MATIVVRGALITEQEWWWWNSWSTETGVIEIFNSCADGAWTHGNGREDT